MLFVCGLFDFGFVLRETKTQLAYKQAKIEINQKKRERKKSIRFPIKNFWVQVDKNINYFKTGINFIAVKVVSECLSIQGLAFVLFSCFVINAKFTFNIVK